MTQRKWMPHEYQDEVVPPARHSPSDWIIRLSDGAYALATGDQFGDAEEPGRPVKEGDIVLFDWTENYGNRNLTFSRSDDGWTWALHGDEPTASPGYDMMVAESGNWESMMPSLDEFASEYTDYIEADGETITVVFYSWSRQPTPFLFRDGSFHKVAPETVHQ